MYESVGAGAFDSVRKPAPVVSAHFVAPSWSQKRQRSDDDDVRSRSSRNDTTDVIDKERSRRHRHDTFVSAPTDTTRFHPTVPKARRDAVTRVLEEEARKAQLETDRQRHLRHNPELPHLLCDPLEPSQTHQSQLPSTTGASSANSQCATTPPSEPEGRTRLLVLDTCVLLRPENPKAMLDWLVHRGLQLVVPFTVINELDFRCKEGDVMEDDGSHGARRKICAGRTARAVRDWLESTTKAADDKSGAVHIQSLREVDLSRLRACINNDDKILACASYFKAHLAKCAEVVIATDDLNLCLKATADDFEIVSSENIAEDMKNSGYGAISSDETEFLNRRTRQLNNRSAAFRRR